MHIVGNPYGAARRLTAIEVRDLELAGTWVVDVRRRPGGDRAGWVVPWEDGIAFLADSAGLLAEAAPEQPWPLDAA
jgi:hypothetical protein